MTGNENCLREDSEELEPSVELKALDDESEPEPGSSQQTKRLDQSNSHKTETKAKRSRVRGGDCESATCGEHVNTKFGSGK